MKPPGEWEKLVSKYADTDEFSLALFRIGQIYEEQLDELQKALESYRKLTCAHGMGRRRSAFTR